MKVFHDPDIGTLRTIDWDGERLFVAEEVCEALGLKHAATAVFDTVDANDIVFLNLPDPQNGNLVDTACVGERGVCLLAEASPYIAASRDFLLWYIRELSDRGVSALMDRENSVSARRSTR